MLAIRGAGAFVVAPETELQIREVHADDGRPTSIQVRLVRGSIRFDADAAPSTHLDLEIGDFQVGTEAGGRMLARAGPGPDDYAVSFLETDGFVLAQGGDRQSIGQGRGVRVAGKQLQPPEDLPGPPTPVSGEEELRVYTTNDAAALARFQFRKEDAVIRLVIARDPLLTDVVATVEGTGALTPPPLPPGTYFWVAARVSDSGLAGKPTETRKIEVVEGPPPAGADEVPSVPVVVHPNRRASVFFAGQVPAVGVDWPGETVPLRYRFRLSRSPKLRRPIADVKIDESRFSSSHLQPGRYYWQVDDAQGGTHRGSFLIARAVRNVRTEKKVVQVSEQYVKSNVVFQQEPPNLSFHWSADDRADGGYRLIVAPQKNPTKVLLTRKTTETQLRLPADRLGEGAFSWRVERLLANGSVFYPGKSRRLVIRFDNDTPSVDIRQPLEGTTTSSTSVRVEGIAPPGTRIFANGKSVALSGSGRFSDTVTVSRRNPRVIFRTHRGTYTAYYVRQLRFVVR